MNQRTHRRGYTLLELLVVLGIAALLASWLASATVAARERATRVTCTSNLRQLVMACKMYEADNEHLPINYGNYPPYGPMGHWQNQIWPYIKDQRVYICPMDPDAGRTGGGHTHTEGGWPYSYPYLLIYFWLDKDGNYRPPAPRSPLFMDSLHLLQNSSGFVKPSSVYLIARYDGSVEAAPPFRYDVIGYEPEDGKDITGRNLQK